MFQVSKNLYLNLFEKLLEKIELAYFIVDTIN